MMASIQMQRSLFDNSPFHGATNTAREREPKKRSRKKKRGHHTPAPRELARRNDPTSSHDAIQEHTDSGSRKQQSLQTLRLVAKHDGLTSMELSASTKLLTRSAIARRLPDLEKRGLVQKGRPRACAANPKHTKGLTWWITNTGKRHLHELNQGKINQ